MRRGSTPRGSTRRTPTTRTSTSDPAFRDAFSAAQNQTLLAVSANTGTDDETVTASTGNTDGFFYVRVQGHDDADFDPDRPFRLERTITGGSACDGLENFCDQPTLAPTRDDARTVIVTDTNKLGLARRAPPYTAYLASLGRPGDGRRRRRRRARRRPGCATLQDQVAGHPDCPYAVNLVAREIKEHRRRLPQRRQHSTS